MTEATTEAPATDAGPAPAAGAGGTTSAAPARRKRTDLSFVPDRELIRRRAATEPDWLTDDRQRALGRFDALPIESNVLYTQYIDLRPADLADVRAWDAPASAPAGGSADATAGAASGVAALIELREDAVERAWVADDAAAVGLTVETLGALVARDPGAARRLLADDTTLPADDRLAQLTRAAWNQGVAIRVPDGVQLDRPIIVRWLAGEPGRALLTRTVVELGTGAAAKLVEELRPSGPEPDEDDAPAIQALFTGSMELHLGTEADLAVASLQEFGERQIAFQHRTAVVGEGANLRWAMAQLGGRLVRSRIDNRLAGDRSSVEQVEIVFGSEDQQFDLTSYTRHVGRDTTGSLLSKGVLLEKARSYMKGLITIEKSAIGTDSFLGEFGMNLSKSTRAVAIPSLEIDQPDCRRAMHSSSVGPIDETQLFYLESRGIPPDEARKFIVLGFLEPVVVRVPLAEAQDRLRELLEEKWAAGLASAAGRAAAGATGGSAPAA